MKRLLMIVGLLAIISCEPHAEHPDDWPHVPPRPKDIPTHNCSGQPINWNWKYQRAYNKGDVHVILSEEGCAIAMVIKVK